MKRRKLAANKKRAQEQQVLSAAKREKQYQLQLEEQRKKREEEAQEAKRFPARPRRDVLGFIMEHAPLENWERDVVSMIREEAYYFLPQMQTKVMNEGWASYWHSNIMTRHVLSDAEVVDYADHHSGTMATQPGGLNPYKLGLELFHDIERRWNKGQFGAEWDNCPRLDEKEAWDRQLGLGRERIFEVRKLYNDVNFIDEVVTALVYNNPVDARYRKASGVERTYTLHPYTLAVFRQGLYLFALDEEANQVKTFALERFTELVRRRREHFDYPRSWSPRAYLANAFGIISGTPEQVAIAFRPQVAGYIRDRTRHPTPTMRTLPDGRLELQLHVATTVELVNWILSFGPDAQVLMPTHLVERIGHRLREAADQYA